MLIKIKITEDMKTFTDIDIDISSIGPVEQSEWLSLQPGMFMHFDNKICAVTSAPRKFSKDGSVLKEVHLKTMAEKELEDMRQQFIEEARRKEQEARLEKAGLVQATSVPANMKRG